MAETKKGDGPGLGDGLGLEDGLGLGDGLGLRVGDGLGRGDRLGRKSGDELGLGEGCASSAESDPMVGVDERQALAISAKDRMIGYNMIARFTASLFLSPPIRSG